MAMKKPDFAETLREMMAGAPRLPISRSSRIVIVSDLHAGSGGPDDDFLQNESLFLHKFKHRAVMEAHRTFYSLLKDFDERGLLYKLVGNHDLALLLRDDHPFPLHHALVLEKGEDRLVCFHGHQASKFFSRHNYVSDFIVRYIAHPLRIRNRDRPFKSQIKNQRRIYKASKELGLASVTGHTHRPLFESMDKKDWLKFSLERLLGSHASSAGAERAAIEDEIALQARELKRIVKRRSRRGYPIRSFYETDGIPVPCLFNSGCVTAKGGFTAIEIENGDISLVEWSRPGFARDWVAREALMRYELPCAAATRFTLRKEPLGVVFSKIRLLGGEDVRAREPADGGAREGSMIGPMAGSLSRVLTESSRDANEDVTETA